ncbi:MAG: hypothetical protein ABMB14_24010, partial [Myxococcota bacterium]
MAKLNKQPPAPPAPAPAPRPVDRGGQAAYSEDLPDDIGGQHRDRDPYPRIPACAPWWFVCVPDRWAVVEGHVIPHLYKLSNAPGANGVERSGSGKANPSLAIASVEAQGHIVLPRDIDGRNYLRSYQVGEAVDRKTGAPVKVLTWVSRWETLYNGSTSIESDGAGFASWVEG